jgi:bifunctional ADP-heptose synthase (sugar kinase/adenylyltransferase)
MTKSGKNYKKLVTKITGKDWTGDRFERTLIHHLPEEVDEYVEHLYACDYQKVKVLSTKEQEIVTIDTPYDEEVNRTRELMYQYFLDRVYDVDGEYLCDYLGITPETLKEQLDYLLGQVR